MAELAGADKHAFTSLLHVDTERVLSLIESAVKKVQQVNWQVSLPTDLSEIVLAVHSYPSVVSLTLLASSLKQAVVCEPAKITVHFQG